ncbi:hypothetical protein CAEBREN_03771 [Caenorhabditis brenneri]|uniref:Uncharacterized protein n=1 Tax=Caenorhabditis brenneri TaxID=135651 RepID=G0PCI7_CAEBE|nr:hypothetical protein CAEBREN_03771 [Caenorhabditis brenneri]
MIKVNPSPSSCLPGLFPKPKVELLRAKIRGLPRLHNRLDEAHGSRFGPDHISSAKLDYSSDVTKRGAYDLFSKAHQDRYEDIPGENNPYIADWLVYEHEKTLMMSLKKVA